MLPIFTEVLASAETAQASDIHLCPGERPMLRVAGALRRLEAPVVEESALRELLAWLLTGHGEAPGEDARDRDFAHTLESGQRLRINAFQTLRGTALAIRRIDAAPPALDSLPVPPAVHDLVGQDAGLVLVTGPTGCGKSTTLAALIQEMNATRPLHIVTIEDPIEFVHHSRESLVSQREVGRHTRSFKTALRAALREDPDVILVGEMRDLETISLALSAAETGHLVLASLHSPSAPQAIDRILDVFPGGEKELVRSMLSTSLSAVIAQRLLPRRGGGRVAAMEVMLGTTAVRNQIREGKVALLHQTIELATAAGMQTLLQSIDRLEAAGDLEPSAARRHRETLERNRLGRGARRSA